jgi:hypothetical protein
MVVVFCLAVGAPYGRKTIQDEGGSGADCSVPKASVEKHIKRNNVKNRI